MIILVLKTIGNQTLSANHCLAGSASGSFYKSMWLLGLAVTQPEMDLLVSLKILANV